MCHMFVCMWHKLDLKYIYLELRFIECMFICSKCIYDYLIKWKAVSQYLAILCDTQESVIKKSFLHLPAPFFKQCALLNFCFYLYFLLLMSEEKLFNTHLRIIFILDTSIYSFM